MQRLVGDGWKVHGLWHHHDKRTTFQWEKAIFKELEVLISLQNPAVEGFVGKRDGHWVESVSADAISLAALSKIVAKIVFDD